MWGIGGARIVAVGTLEPISRRAALAQGVADRELYGRAWQRVCRGQYVPAGQATAMSEVARHLVLTRAVTRELSDEAVVSHISAAVVHGLPIWCLPLNRVHVTRNRRTGARTGPKVRVHTAALDADEVVEVEGLRVTSVERTVVDLARKLPLARAVVLGDAALRDRTTADRLAVQLERAKGSRGCPAARRAVAQFDGRAESPGESLSRLVMREAGLPPPQLQATILDGWGEFVGRVDFLFPERGVIGEFDGLVKYRGGSPETTVIKEKVREDALRALGWLVVRWTWSELDHPTRWLAALNRPNPVPRSGSWTAASSCHTPYRPVT